MRLWLPVFFTILAGVFGVQGQPLFDEELHSSSAFEVIERSFCVLYIEGLASHRSLHGALRSLRIVKDQISSIERRYAKQPHIISAIDTLLVLKGEQIKLSNKSLSSLKRHLKQLKEGLSLALNTDYELTQAEVVPLHNEALAVDILSGFFERSIQSVTVSTDGNMNPALIKTLKTGAFLMVMLSTTADVCVITGPLICFALYIAGSGAVVIWFTQIYRTTLGMNGVSESSY